MGSPRSQIAHSIKERGAAFPGLPSWDRFSPSTHTINGAAYLSTVLLPDSAKNGSNSEHTDHMTQVIHPKGEIGKEENESID